MWSAPVPVASTPTDDLVDEATVLTPRAQAARGPRWALSLPDATTVPLSGTCVVGRRPVPPPESPDAEPIALADPLKTLSKTHALIEVANDGLWITDLGSTNGTEITTGDGTARPARAHERISVLEGDTIAFGDLVVRAAKH